MDIDDKTVDYVAKLARLNLDEQEVMDLRGDLSQIVGYVAKLRELNTSNVAQTAHVLPLKNVFREDMVKPSMNRKVVLANTEHKQDGFFVVPKIFE